MPGREVNISVLRVMLLRYSNLLSAFPIDIVPGPTSSQIFCFPALLILFVPILLQKYLKFNRVLLATMQVGVPELITHVFRHLSSASVYLFAQHIPV